MKKQMKEFVHLLSTRRSRYELTDSKDIDNKNIIKFIGKILKTLPSP
jgi:predicted oxidoreductase (fatty acid repression mutant protein)